VVKKYQDINPTNLLAVSSALGKLFGSSPGKAAARIFVAVPPELNMDTVIFVPATSCLYVSAILSNAAFDAA
jgi:hypothetical protein